MYKVVQRCWAPNKSYHGTIWKSRLYGSEETFNRYGKKLIGLKWSWTFGVAYKVSALTWERISKDFPKEIDDE